MKKDLLTLKRWPILLLTVGISYFSNAQVGINVTDPQSTLHIEAENKALPTTTDGILVPRVSMLPSSTTATEGQLVFLTTTSGSNTVGFYVFNGTIWDKLHEDAINQNIDKSIIVAMGNNTTTTYSNHSNASTLILNSIVNGATTGTTVNDNKVVIGKAGTYLVTVSSSLKTESTTSGGHRASFLYRLRHTSGSTTTYPASGMASIPNQATTATFISFSDIITLKQGDTLDITRQRDSDAEASLITFLPYGNNTLRLTFLQ